MRITFAGTPEFAATILRGLFQHGYPPDLVLTQPDRPAGRGRKLQPSPVKRMALENGIPVRQPTTLRPGKPAGADALDHLLRHPMDVLIVAAYGLILPKALLDHPTHGAINVHASLLPRWRGAAPIERAILAGDTVSGATIMQMDEGLDTGDIILASECSIESPCTGEDATNRIAHLGVALLTDGLPDIADLPRTPQDERLATHAPKLRAEEAEIRWHEHATDIHNQVRALTGRMPAFTRALDGVRMRILSSAVVDGHPEGAEPGTIVAAPRGRIRVACGTGTLEVTRLQLSTGKGKAMDAAAAMNGYGHFFSPGQKLG